MCLQDLQLARALSVEVIDFTASGTGSQPFLPEDPSRVGVVILGPNTGTVDFTIGASASRATICRSSITNSPDNRIFTITNYGIAITYAWFFSGSTTNQFRAYIYTLPMDRDQLQRLANQGKF